MEFWVFPSVEATSTTGGNQRDSLTADGGAKSENSILLGAVQDTHCCPTDVGPISIQNIRVSSKSSSKNEQNMLTEGVSSYWESSASRPHYIELEIPDGFVWTDVMLFTHDFGDYSPEIVNVKVGDKMIKSSIKLSRGWSL